MIKSLEIGKYIYSRLTTNQAFSNVKVYPLVAENGAKFPFVVYRRLDLASGDSKDGCFEDKAAIEIIVVSDKYSDGLDLASKIREIIEVPYATHGELEVNDAILSLATEEYNDAFIQKMVFRMNVNKK